MDNVPILDVIAILVSVSVFSTGFLSVRLHAQRDRAISRAQEIKGFLVTSENIEPKKLLSWLADEHNQYEQAYKLDPVAKYTGYMNVVVLILVVFLAILIGIKENWQWARNISEIAFGFYALAALVIIEAGVVILGLRDAWNMQIDVSRRRVATPYFTIDQAFKWMEGKHYDLAASWLDDLIEREPELPIPRMLRGNAFFEKAKELKEQGEESSAKEYYKKFYEDSKQIDGLVNHYGVLLRMGIALIALGDYGEAVSHLTNAIKINPKAKSLYLLRGEAYEQLGENNEAQQDYIKAKQLNNQNDF
ncbi:MAG: tetratricopeptide repeat protein [Pyrinomonadaceae bacterium]